VEPGDSAERANALEDGAEAPRCFVVTEADRAQYRRLDLFLAAKLPDLSRTTVKRLYEDDNVTTPDGKSLSLSKMPPVGTEVEVEVPPPITTDLIAQNIPLEVLFEDSHLIIIVKPAGLCVHPAPGHPNGTLVNALLYHVKDLQGIGGETRPGIVHRLDLGTSGVMVAAKNQATHEALVQLFSKHDIEREYQAIVWGKPTSHLGRIESFIGRMPHHRQKMSCQVKAGKKAITDYKVIESGDGMSHVSCKLYTGRTHQIRVHMAQALQAPVVCDQLYADVNKQMSKLSPSYQALLKPYPYQLLHAKVLGFKHPMTGEQLRFEAPTPEPFKTVLAMMRGELK